MKKYTYQTTSKLKALWILGTYSENEYINEETKDGWELIGPPIDDKTGDWVYYWRKKENL